MRTNNNTAAAGARVWVDGKYVVTYPEPGTKTITWCKGHWA